LVQGTIQKLKDNGTYSYIKMIINGTLSDKNSDELIFACTLAPPRGILV
jgi:hypothetical protein